MLAACQTTGSTGTSAADPVEAALQRGAASGPESLSSIERLYKQDSSNPDLAVRYARALRENGRITRAAMVLNPLIENPKTKTIGVITEFAAVQASMGNYELAEKHARAAVLKDQNSAEAYHVLGIALDAQGFNKQAEVAFRKALDNWTGDPSAVLNNLGLNLAAQGFLDESLSTLRRAAALAPDKTEIERNLRIVQALQVQPGTNTAPYAQTKSDQAKSDHKSTEKPVKAETAKPVPVKPAPIAKTAPAPDNKKEGGIVVENLNSGDKQTAAESKTDKAGTSPARTQSVNQ